MDATVAANLLLAATIAIFILLTLIAFLLNEGKPIFVEPFRVRMKQRFGSSSLLLILLGDPIVNEEGGGESENERNEDTLWVVEKRCTMVMQWTFSFWYLT